VTSSWSLILQLSQRCTVQYIYIRFHCGVNNTHNLSSIFSRKKPSVHHETPSFKTKFNVMFHLIIWRSSSSFLSGFPIRIFVCVLSTISVTQVLLILSRFITLKIVIDIASLKFRRIPLLNSYVIKRKFSSNQITSINHYFCIL